MFLQDFSCLCLCLNLVTCLQHTARYCNTHGLVPCSRICRFTCTHRHPLHMHGQTPTITNLCARSTRFAAKNNNLFFATCVCIYPSIYSYIHTHVCIYLRVYIYMYIYIYIHMYILVCVCRKWKRNCFACPTLQSKLHTHTKTPPLPPKTCGERRCQTQHQVR